MLKLWHETIDQDPISNEQVRNQIIWWNSNIRRDHKPVCYAAWLNAGLIKIDQLILDNGSFKTRGQLESDFGMNINFVDYYGILEAIPARWKAWLKETAGPAYKNWYENILKGKSAVKILYNKINTNESLLAKVLRKWNENKCELLSYEQLIGAMRNISKTTIYVKLRAFQFCLLVRGIVTNINLYYYKIKDSKLCEKCKAVNETVEHLFWECNQIQKFWKEFQEKYCIKIINFQELVLNNVDRNPKNVKNLLVLIAKHYIYSARCVNDSLSISKCSAAITNIKNIEENIATSKNKLAIHETKWENFD